MTICTGAGGGEGLVIAEKHFVQFILAACAFQKMHLNCCLLNSNRFLCCLIFLLPIDKPRNNFLMFSMISENLTDQTV